MKFANLLSGHLPVFKQSRPPGRDLEVLESDVMVTSYPRSGNTWVRFVLTNLVRSDLSNPLRAVQQVIPDIYTMSRKQLSRLTPPRMLKSHEYFDHRYRRVIYLVRDPRAVAVSYFHFQRQAQILAQDVSLTEWVEDFVAGKVDRFGNWQEHVQSWLATRGDSSEFLLVRYEDLLDNPTVEARSIGSFAGLDGLTDERVSAALEGSSVTQLRTIQDARSAAAHPALVRMGTAQNWRTELPKAAIQRIEVLFGRTMRELGYLE